MDIIGLSAGKQRTGVDTVRKVTAEHIAASPMFACVLLEKQLFQRLSYWLSRIRVARFSQSHATDSKPAKCLCAPIETEEQSRSRTMCLRTVYLYYIVVFYIFKK